MHTPYFPTLRSRLAALGRRTTHLVRQATLAQLEAHLRDFLPAPLLSAEDQGPNSRDRVFSLRLTFECFLWQLLNPKTSCREVVRQVQALFRLQGRGHVDEADSAGVRLRWSTPRPPNWPTPARPTTLPPTLNAEARLRLSRPAVCRALLP